MIRALLLHPHRRLRRVLIQGLQCGLNGCDADEEEPGVVNESLHSCAVSSTTGSGNGKVDVSEKAGASWGQPSPACPSACVPSYCRMGISIGYAEEVDVYH